MPNSASSTTTTPATSRSRPERAGRLNETVMDASTFNLDDHLVPTPRPRVHLIRDFISAADEAFLLRKTDEVGDSNVVVNEDGTMAGRAGGWTKLSGRRSMYWGGVLSPKGALLPQPPPPFMVTEYPNVFSRIAALGIFSPTPSSDLTASAKGKSTSNGEPAPVAPNHCLVNEYLPGDGILPHTDGPAYFPTVATLSLGSHAVYDFYRYLPVQEGETSSNDSAKKSEKEGRPIDPTPVFSLFVPARSLIVLSSEVYTSLLHSIPPRTSDRRTSLARCLNFSPTLDTGWETPQGGEPIVGEAEQGLERERRISLTCRKVEKVVKALGRFGR